jgi:hypothetical protein
MCAFVLFWPGWLEGDSILSDWVASKIVALLKIAIIIIKEFL